MELLRIAWRNLGRHKIRTGLTAAATVFAVALTTLTFAMQAGSYERWIRHGVRLYPGHIEVSLNGYRDNRTLDYSMTLDPVEKAELDRLPGSLGWAPRLESFALAIPDREESVGRAALLIGVDPEREAPLTRLAESVVTGSFFDGGEDREVVVGTELARNLGVEVGESLILLSSDYYGSQAAERFRLAGTVSLGSAEFDGHLVLARLDQLQPFLESEDGVSHVALFAAGSADVEPLRVGASRVFASDDYEILTWQDLIPELEQMILLDNIGGKLSLGVLIVVVSFGLLNTVLMSVMERVREFGVMRSLGMRPGGIFRLVMIESALLALLGIAVGLLLALPLILFLEGNPIPLDALSDPEALASAMAVFEIEPVIEFHLRAVDVLIAPVVVLLIALLAAIPPALRASRGRPVDALRMV